MINVGVGRRCCIGDQLYFVDERRVGEAPRPAWRRDRQRSRRRSTASSSVMLKQKSSAESTSDEDDDINPSATVNGAAVGRTIVSDIVGGSGVGVNYGGRRRRVLDTVVAVDVDRRGSSVATPNVGSSSVILRRSVLQSSHISWAFVSIQLPKHSQDDR